MEASEYRKTGERRKTTIYTFDEKGRVSEQAQKDGPNVPFGSQFRRQDKRDEKGVVTEFISYAKDGKVERRALDRYETFDSHGNWIRRTESFLDKNRKPLPDQFTTQRTITYY